MIRWLWMLCWLCWPLRVLAQDVAVGNPRAFLPADNVIGTVSDAVLSPDGRRVAIYGFGILMPDAAKDAPTAKVQIWDVAQRHLIFDLAAHTDSVNDVKWSRDGKLLVSESQDSMVVLWDAETGKPLHVLAPTQEIRLLDDNRIESIEAKIQGVAKLFSRPVLLGFSSDGRQVLALGRDADLPGWIAATKADTNEDGSFGKKPFSAADFLTFTLLKWNVDDGRLARKINLSKRGDTQFGFDKATISGDGKSFVLSHHPRFDEGGQKTSLQENYLEVRDLDTGEVRASTPLPVEFSALTALSADGSRALLMHATSQEMVKNRAQVWDVVEKKPLQVLADENTDFSLGQFSSDNRQFLAPQRAGAIGIFSVASGQQERTLSGGHCYAPAIFQMTPDGKNLLSGAGILSPGVNMERLQWWDLTTPSIMPRALAEARDARALAVAPDGSIWSAWSVFEDGENMSSEYARSKSLELRHISPTGAVLDSISLEETSLNKKLKYSKHLKAVNTLIDELVFSPDAQLVAATLGRPVKADERASEGVGVWDIATKKLLWRLPGEGALRDVLAFSPDGQTLAVARTTGGPVELWDMKSGQLARTILSVESGVSALCFAPDGETLAIASGGSTTVIFDLPGNAIRDELSEETIVSHLEFSPDGKSLLSGGDFYIQQRPFGFQVRLWDVSAHRVLRQWSGEERWFGGAGFSPAGKSVAFSHQKDYFRRGGGQIEWWNIADEKRLALLNDFCGAQLPTFAPDGSALMSVDGEWIKSWDLANPTP